MEGKEFDYINVIPFIDIMLVLLTIVLTTSTFIARGTLPINLPQASAHQGETLKTLMIEIDGSGRILFNRQPATLARLKEGLQEYDRQLPVLVSADRTLPLQRFVEVIDMLRNLNFHRVSLQTETKS